MTGLQDEIIEFLSDPRSYGSDQPVERIETHCSIVFLAGEFAYKLKRAIRYASLDYTKPELRRIACEAELRLNRRTAPDMYLNVRSIARSAAGVLVFDGTEPALDYVVVMRRFAQSDLLEAMAERAKLTPELMVALGHAVAEFHQAAEPRPNYGGSDAIRRVIADNDRELAKVAAELDGAAVGTLSTRARHAVDVVAPLLEQRRLEGKVRCCHGDLRLANIVLLGNRPTLFDCIEFSDEIGCIDVLYDLAFLLMDLLLRDRADLANIVFNTYLDIVPETNGLRALPLFLSLRAATRGYALAGSASRRKPRQAARLLALAHRHIDAGIAFVTSHQPMLIALGGDVDRVTMNLAAPLAALAEPAPGARILPMANMSAAAPILRAGCSVMVEGSFIDVAERVAVTEIAVQQNVPLLRLWFGRRGDAENWHAIDPAQGAIAGLASIAPLISATAARSGLCAL